MYSQLRNDNIPFLLYDAAQARRERWSILELLAPIRIFAV
jgi:hypothetical protein